MNRKGKKAGTLFVAVLLIFTLQIAAAAAEDDAINEADIYLGEQAFAALQPVQRDKVEGTKTSNISDSPAVAYNEVEIIRIYDEESQQENTNAQTEWIAHAPATGIPSNLLPIGTWLMALSCVPIVLKKKKS